MERFFFLFVRKHKTFCSASPDHTFFFLFLYSYLLIYMYDISTFFSCNKKMERSFCMAWSHFPPPLFYIPYNVLFFFSKTMESSFRMAWSHFSFFFFYIPYLTHACQTWVFFFLYETIKRSFPHTSWSHFFFLFLFSVSHACKRIERSYSHPWPDQIFMF